MQIPVRFRNRTAFIVWSQKWLHWNKNRERERIAATRKMTWPLADHCDHSLITWKVCGSGFIDGCLNIRCMCAWHALPVCACVCVLIIPTITMACSFLMVRLYIEEVGRRKSLIWMKKLVGKNKNGGPKTNWIRGNVHECAVRRREPVCATWCDAKLHTNFWARCWFRQNEHISIVRLQLFVVFLLRDAETEHLLTRTTTNTSIWPPAHAAIRSFYQPPIHSHRHSKRSKIGYDGLVDTRNGVHTAFCDQVHMCACVCLTKLLNNLDCPSSFQVQQFSET